MLDPGKWFKLSFIYNKVRLRKKTPGRDDRGEGVGGLGGGGTQVEVEEAQGELERSGTKVDKFNSLNFFPTNLKSSEKQQIVAEINEESFTSKSIIKTLY